MQLINYIALGHFLICVYRFCIAITWTLGYVSIIHIPCTGKFGGKWRTYWIRRTNIDRTSFSYVMNFAPYVNQKIDLASSNSTPISSILSPLSWKERTACSKTRKYLLLMFEKTFTHSHNSRRVINPLSLTNYSASIIALNLNVFISTFLLGLSSSPFCFLPCFVVLISLSLM